MRLVHRRLPDGLEQWQRKAGGTDSEPIPELRNVAVWTPDNGVTA